MIINHNMQAINTHRQMGMVQTSQSKSMEKLSSGYRINRAGDDAAGLQISEKMRAQIRGLNQASRNSQDAISLVQTAEGALNETQNILQRMRELAVQSASDTNVDVDRDAIQNEIDQLVTEIDRISETTEFNTQNLLDGSFDGTFQIGANEGQTIDLSINGVSAAGLGLAASVTLASETIAANTGSFALADGTYTMADATTIVNSAGEAVAEYSAANTITLSDGATNLTTENVLVAGDTFTVENGTTFTFTKALVAGQTNDDLAAGDYTFATGAAGLDVKKDGVVIGTSAAGSGVIQFTDTTIADMDLNAVFGVEAADVTNGFSMSVNGADISSQGAAEGSITTINDAITAVSQERAKLGAVQNRLEHTIANLDTTAENMQASESRIRDVDMAAEMMEFTKNNILSQAAQSMLAQANQAPQGVLQLLR